MAGEFFFSFHMAPRIDMARDEGDRRWEALDEWLTVMCDVSSFMSFPACI